MPACDYTIIVLYVQSLQTVNLDHSSEGQAHFVFPNRTQQLTLMTNLVLVWRFGSYLRHSFWDFFGTSFDFEINIGTLTTTLRRNIIQMTFLTSKGRNLDMKALKCTLC